MASKIIRPGYIQAQKLVDARTTMQKINDPWEEK